MGKPWLQVDCRLGSPVSRFSYTGALCSVTRNSSVIISWFLIIKLCMHVHILELVVLGQQYLVICAIQIIFADVGSFSDEIFGTWKMISSRKVGGLSSRWPTETCTWQFRFEALLDFPLVRL